MTFQKSFVLQKLENILDYLKELEELLKFSDQEILTESGKVHIAERLLQLIVDAIIDVNQHFIKELNLKVSEDFQGTFYILAENKILPNDFAVKIAPVVGLRNVIIHQYEKIDKPLFIKTLRKDYSDFKKYLRLIHDYLKTTK